MDEEHPITHPMLAPRVGERLHERVEGSWLVLDYPKNPPIRLDARIFDRVFVDDERLIVSVDETAVTMKLLGGSSVARSLAEQLAFLTRAVPITAPEVLEDARRRLATVTGKRDTPLPPTLWFGDEGVRASDTILYVGRTAFWIEDVKHYALAGRELPLPSGKMQAALASLVIADRERVEDPIELASRIAYYEDRLDKP